MQYTYFYFAKSHVNNTFTLVLIQFICVACLLVCKYTNQKKVDLCPIQIGVWYILAKNIAFWLVDLMQPFFRAWRDFTASQRWFLKQQFCLTDLKVRFWYATMNAWIQIWVQGEMCGNNTIKLEWHIYNVSISPFNEKLYILHWLYCGSIGPYL